MKKNDCCAKISSINGSRHEERCHLAMAGEYLVAGQLERLHLTSSITYGNAKSADVIAVNLDSEKLAVIEVKTSSRGRWPIGSKVPESSDKIWVFVHIPEKIEDSPEFYILTHCCPK